MTALNSRSLGPPIRHNKDQPCSYGEFNIDHITIERYETHEKAWSRLNVSDGTAGTLSGRNPTAKCFCWKMVLCSQMDNPDGDKLQNWSQGTHFTAGSWLLSKLMPTRKEDGDDLIISSPSLSIWKKWVPSQSGGDLTCCLSIIKDVKDAKLDNMNQTALGASAVLFLVSESISWDWSSKSFGFVTFLCLYLLVVTCPFQIESDSHRENSDSSSIMAEQLGLRDFDKSRISNFSVVFLAKNQQSEHSDGFFSDEQLREGLQWLASESPLQPVLSCVKMHELVLTDLNSSLEVIDGMSVYEVGPDHCISAFNEALDRAVEKVTAAADANPAS